MKSTPPPGHTVFAPWGESYHCWEAGPVAPDRPVPHAAPPYAYLGGATTCLKRHGHQGACEFSVDCQPHGIDPPPPGYWRIRNAAGTPGLRKAADGTRTRKLARGCPIPHLDAHACPARLVPGPVLQTGMAESNRSGIAGQGVPGGSHEPGLEPPEPMG